MQKLDNQALLPLDAPPRDLAPNSPARPAEVVPAQRGAISPDIYYTYSGFAMTMLPHKEIKGDQNWVRESWVQDNGNVHMMVEPGAHLLHGQSVKFGIPYGARARLIMFYLQTEAKLTNSRTVHLGRSMTAWMSAMQMPTGGSNIKHVREQAMRLSACRLTVGWTGPDGEAGFSRENIVGSMLIPAKGCGDWDETATLSEGFFKALTKHAMPIDSAAITEIQNSSQLIDVYVWLCYRLHELKEDQRISWQALYSQFGHSYSAVRQFRWRFKESLKEVMKVYPEAKIGEYEGGLILKPSKPAIEKRTIHVVKGIAARSGAALLPRPAGRSD